MYSFSEITKQVHQIDDLILSDMIYDNTDVLAEEALRFSRHVLSTKQWFARISWSNKKRYILALLDDIRSAWTLSLLLKSLWNCRPKDAVLSASETNVWSSYDQVPMDHNRTAQPVHTLAQVMKNDRAWFLSLDVEPQAIVLSELLTIAGGPIMWEVLKHVQVIYEKYRAEQLRNLQECVVINEPITEKTDERSESPDKGKKEPISPHRRKSSASTPEEPKTPLASGQAQKELDCNLSIWNATIKSLRDSVKLQELELTFKDGTKRKIWKVNRPKPEATETVDLIQLLPAAIGKRILSYLPRAQLGDYARVNKYWAYLVEDLRAEVAARIKINAELNKFQEIMLRHDTSMEVLAQIDFQVAQASSLSATSGAPSAKVRPVQPSVRASERSGGAVSFRHLLNGKLTKPAVAQKPFRNLAEVSERLERRGAADENLWRWCQNVNKHMKPTKKAGRNVEKLQQNEGVLKFGNFHFPCPLMKMSLEIPLKTPLCKDPTEMKYLKPIRNISNATVNVPKQKVVKRFSLWTQNFSKLYPVLKISSHQSPF